MVHHELGFSCLDYNVCVRGVYHDLGVHRACCDLDVGAVDHDVGCTSRSSRCLGVDDVHHDMGVHGVDHALGVDVVDHDLGVHRVDHDLGRTSYIAQSGCKSCRSGFRVWSV